MQRMISVGALALCSLFLSACAPHVLDSELAMPNFADHQFEADLGKHLTAVQSRDLEELSSTLADDVQVIFPAGQRVIGKDGVLAFHEDWFSDEQWIWTPEIIEIHEGRDISSALVRYTYTEKPGADPRTSWLLLEFRYTPHGWLLYHDQNTRIEDDQG